MKTFSIGLLAVALLFGCEKASEKIAVAMSAEEKTYPITGIALEANRENNTIFIQHDGVPGVIQAETTAFELRGEKVESLTLSLAGKRPFVTATLHKKGRQLWVTDVKPQR